MPLSVSQEECLAYCTRPKLLARLHTYHAPVFHSPLVWALVSTLSFRLLLVTSWSGNNLSTSRLTQPPPPILTLPPILQGHPRLKRTAPAGLPPSVQGKLYRTMNLSVCFAFVGCIAFQLAVGGQRPPPFDTAFPIA